MSFVSCSIIDIHASPPTSTYLHLIIINEASVRVDTVRERFKVDGSSRDGLAGSLSFATKISRQGGGK